MIICIFAALMIFHVSLPGFTGIEGADNTNLTEGELATLQDDRAERRGSRTIYDLSDYENNEILVADVDGTVRVIQCGSEAELRKQLNTLKKNHDVETYQPNFHYTADKIMTVSAESSSLPVFYGAPDEKQAMDDQIRKRAEVNIANVHPALPSDPYYYLQWGLNNNGTFTGATEKLNPQPDIDINAPEAWAHYKAKRSAVIALIDTGVEYTNPEISSSIWINTDEIADNGIDDDGNGYIDDVRGWNFYKNNNQIFSGAEDDHGSHCAMSMMAASNYAGITGIADYTNIRLMVLKTLGGGNGEGTTLSIMKAIQYAEQNGASICNLSLGTTVNDYLLYRTMKNSSMLFITAAGNSSSPSERGTDIDRVPCYPASYSLENIIAVANVNAEGQLHYTSDYGAVAVDLAAPGSDILGITSENRMAFMTGTSMAAPMVTAAAAMVYTGSYSRSLIDTAMILKKTVKKVPGLAGVTSSGGMLDLASAVQWKQ